MEFAAPNKVPRQARKPTAESQSMNGGTSREIPPSIPQIASAAITAGTQSIAWRCEWSAIAVRVLPGSEKQSNPAQAPSCRKDFFISSDIRQSSA